MKEYVEAKLEMVTFDAEDVITTSATESEIPVEKGPDMEF